MKKPNIFSIWNEKILTLTEFQSLGTISENLSQAQLQYLSIYGIIAPTSHNSVPQRFRLGKRKNSLILFLDREFILPQSDPFGRQALVSLGCVIRNIEIAALAYGWSAKSIFLPVSKKGLLHSKIATQTQKFSPVVELRFSSITRDDQAFEALDLMFQRKVIRAEYDPTQKLPTTLTKSLVKIAKQYDRLQLHIIDNRLIMRGFGKFQEQADRFVMENSRFANELGEWLLANDDQTVPYAMRGREFGFDDQFAKHIHLGLLGKKKLLPDQISFFAKGGKSGIDSSSAVAVITVEKDNTALRIEAGKFYEDMALELLKAGFYTSVHAGITEVDWVNTMFATTVLHTSYRPTMVFRIGVPKRKQDLRRSHPARPKVEDLWI